jgi:hypothetical protein
MRLDVDAILDPNEVRVLLSTLCIKLGFCLPPTEIEKLIEALPRNVEDFTRAVFVAEGVGIAKSDPLFKQVKELAARAFAKHGLETPAVTRPRRHPPRGRS